MTPRERLVLDLTIFAVVMAAANPALTGLSFHEWLGFVLVLPALVHLVVNWDWVLRVCATFFGRARNASRLNLAIDAGLFGALVAVTLSGVLVIPGLSASLGLSASGEWHAVHLAASNLTIAFTLAHFAMHWRWIVDVTRRWATPSARVPTARRSVPESGVASAARRVATPVTMRPVPMPHTAAEPVVPRPAYRR